jgi:hypothetical protein
MNNRDSNLAGASNSIVENDVNTKSDVTTKTVAEDEAPTETISPMAAEVVSTSTSVVQGSTASSQHSSDNRTRIDAILEADEENL